MGSFWILPRKAESSLDTRQRHNSGNSRRKQSSRIGGPEISEGGLRMAHRVGSAGTLHIGTGVLTP